MLNFKQYLQEKQDNFAPWHIRDKQQLEKIISSSFNMEQNVTLLKNGSIRVKTSAFTLGWPTFYAEKNNFDVTKLPFKFSTVKARLKIASRTLLDIWGAPDTAKTLDLQLGAIKSLQHLNGTYSTLVLNCRLLEEFNCDTNVNYIFFESSPAKFDFKDFRKSFPNTNMIRFLFSENNIFNTIPLLSFYKYKIDIKPINPVGSAPSTEFDKVSKVYNLYQYHLQQKTDILGFQDVLIENGFKEYAKL